MYANFFIAQSKVPDGSRPTCLPVAGSTGHGAPALVAATIAAAAARTKIERRTGGILAAKLKNNMGKGGG